MGEPALSCYANDSYWIPPKLPPKVKKNLFEWIFHVYHQPLRMDEKRGTAGTKSTRCTDRRVKRSHHASG
jgi:hypothetical protein